jgi:hypothetical protein
MREANQKIANIFRTFADKPTMNYSQREQKFSKDDESGDFFRGGRSPRFFSHMGIFVVQRININAIL